MYEPFPAIYIYIKLMDCVTIYIILYTMHLILDNKVHIIMTFDWTIIIFN